MKSLMRIYCRWFGHDFRRARKNQDPTVTTCRRCAATRQIKRRMK